MPKDSVTVPRRPRRSVEPALRFWTKVNKEGPVIRADLGQCWEWTAFVDAATGYGRFSMGPTDTPRIMRLVGAHRASWEISFGPIREGMMVLHLCDNRKCVRPEHLYEGTSEDNGIDRMHRSPMRRGEQSHCSKLTEQSVKKIVEMCNAGVLNKEAAMEFGVRAATVSDIMRGVSWTHVTGIRKRE